MPLSDLTFDFMSWFRLRTFGKSIKILLDLLEPNKEDVILDVGAGTGIIASKVAAVCDEVFAVEPKLERVNYIKRKFPEVKAFDGTAESVRFPESYFTKIYSVSAFHHFSDQDQAVSEFDRILKPGGLVLIHELYPKSSIAKMEKRISGMKFLTPESLREKFGLAGFHEKRLEETNQGYFALFQKP
jgi:ubiquinone/menaquinone biosynthesis C-methylase UbiE